ncbi:hypothetical protein I8752_00505 [Nostocaceae cyanobacterium CENA369]|uniref:Uncharacterized protein n=1 Tax=Dendronalium phyllosphericum CENA369 TaxID=1725256 RepID=A0A8J7HWP9_9NOST|nr:hypothetical protein [Dendronalium phyllosphericum]MBH8571529.1 hypothetical protein [Dendronalium phyllosphericum CENA369]
MNAEIARRTKPEGYIQNTSLILIALASTFFSRLIETAGLPGLINFLHFAIVPVTVGIVLASSRAKDRYQIASTWAILSGLLLFLGVMLISALLNKAGLINVVLDFLLLGEPFLLLAAIISIPFSPKSLAKLQTWIMRFCFINLFLAYLQNYIIVPYFYNYLHTNLGGADLVQGVFFISGGGNSLSAGVSLIFSVYIFQKVNKAPFWLRIIVPLASFWQVLMSDSKQPLVVFIIAWAILSLVTFKNIRKLFLYVISVVVVIAVLFWCIQNLEIFRAYKTYVDPYWYDPNERTMQIKFAALRIIPSYYHSPLNLWFGLGPGHTVGRLGGGMLSKYEDLLKPLGVTISPVGQAVWDEFGSLAFGGQVGSISTIFSPFWGWAGIWGDLGFVGLGTYLYLASLVWSRLCKDSFSKFLLLNVLIVGFVFTQLEEPGYMLFIAMIVGLIWQENRQENLKMYGR